MEENAPAFAGVIVTPVRMGCPTLPGRPLRPLGSSTVLGQWIKRTQLLLPNIRLIIATSDQESDRPILEFCLKYGVPCVIDSPNSSWMHLTETLSSLSVAAVAVCSLSNPLIEPSLLQAAFAHCIAARADYVTYFGLPEGCSIEVLSLNAYLTLSSQENPYPSVSAAILPAPPEYAAPELWLKCETESDYSRLASLYQEMVPSANGTLDLADVITHLQEDIPVLYRAA